MLTDLACPNGLAFSPDTRKLYVPGSGRMFGSDPIHIRAFDAGDDLRALTGGEVFDRVDPGRADGLRCDEDGILWSSAAHTSHRVAPERRLLGKISFPRRSPNSASAAARDTVCSSLRTPASMRSR